jgi:hypothetical protein
VEEGLHIPIKTLADGVTAGLLRELAAGLASKLACHLYIFNGNDCSWYKPLE